MDRTQCLVWTCHVWAYSVRNRRTFVFRCRSFLPRIEFDNQENTTQKRPGKQMFGRPSCVVSMINDLSKRQMGAR